MVIVFWSLYKILQILNMSGYNVWIERIKSNFNNYNNIISLFDTGFFELVEYNLIYRHGGI